MRINQFVAHATGLSRRSIDIAISDNKVKVNDQPAKLGQSVEIADKVTLDNQSLVYPDNKILLLLNKPTGYVCSRDGQGAPTVYDLLPEKYHQLKYIGRLDKDSSGLVVMTDDGVLINSLSHPSFDKTKTYLVELNKPIRSTDIKDIESGKIFLDYKPSVMKIKPLNAQNKSLEIELKEGRNRQIRRTFSKLNYDVTELSRTKLGPYSLEQLENNSFLEIII